MHSIICDTFQTRASLFAAAASKVTTTSHTFVTQHHLKRIKVCTQPQSMDVDSNVAGASRTVSHADLCPPLCASPSLGHADVTALAEARLAEAQLTSLKEVNRVLPILRDHHINKIRDKRGSLTRCEGSQDCEARGRLLHWRSLPSTPLRGHSARH